MKVGTLVRLNQGRGRYEAVTVAKPVDWYHIQPGMVGMFIEYDNGPRRSISGTGGIFLFEEKLVRAYIEVFEPLEESG